ncbi:MAG: hypothetical protein ACXIU7_11150 [Roseinatronobacter sp.]
MIVVCLILSIMTGLIAATTVFTLGFGFWLALLSYSLSGAAALVISMSVVALSSPSEKPDEGRDGAP